MSKSWVRYPLMTRIPQGVKWWGGPALTLYRFITDKVADHSAELLGMGSTVSRLHCALDWFSYFASVEVAVCRMSIMLRTTSNFVRNGFSPYQERLISGKPCPKSGWKTRATLCNIEYVNKSAIAKLSLQMQMNRYHLFTYTAVLFLIFQLIKQYKEGLSSLPEGDFIIDASP